MAYDPLMGFGSPPQNAVADDDAMAAAMGHVPATAMPPNIWEAQASESLSVLSVSEPEPLSYDEEAMRQAIIQQTKSENDNSKAYQAKTFAGNAEASMTHRKQTQGIV